jgi:hypothetical protein
MFSELDTPEVFSENVTFNCAKLRINHWKNSMFFEN